MTLDGFVLAGGRSTRMGTDKARLPFPDGWPMATAVATVLATRCARVALVRRGAPDGLPWPRPDGGQWEVIRDADDRAPHPLNGLVTACAAARTPMLLVVPCDVPFLPAQALERLLAAGEAPVVAAGEERVHPLIGVFPREIGADAARAAEAGRSVRDFLAGVRRVDLPGAWLRNVNRWEDTGRAEKPLEALAAAFPGVRGAALDRLLAGEKARLAARGAVAPG